MISKEKKDFFLDSTKYQRTKLGTFARRTKPTHTKANLTKEPALFLRFLDRLYLIDAVCSFTSAKRRRMYNIGISAIAGMDVETSPVCIAALLFGQTCFNLALLLTSTLYFQLCSGSGLDVIKYPTCINTCSLAVIVTDEPRW